MKKFLLFVLTLAGMTAISASAATVGDVYTKVTNINDLTAGDEYILCYTNVGMGSLNGKFCEYIADGVTLNDNNATIAKADVMAFTLVTGTANGTLAILMPDGKYLTCTSITNGNLGSSTTLIANSNLTITMKDDGTFAIVPTQNSNNGQCKIQCNTGQPRFTNYKTGSQNDCIFYKKAPAGPVDFVFDGFKDYAMEVNGMEELELPDDAPAITFVSSNTEVAEVDDNTILAYAKGTATITASWGVSDKWNAGSVSFTITVTGALEDATMVFGSDNTYELLLGQTLTVGFMYEGDENAVITVSCDKPEVATAVIEGENVVITPLAAGTVVITLTAAATETHHEASDFITVHITDPNNNEAVVTMSNQGTPTYGNNKTVTWKSDDGAYEFATSATVSVNTTYPLFSGGHLRLYTTSNNVLTINAPEGYLFVSSSINYENTDHGFKINDAEVTNNQVYSFAEPVDKFEVTATVNKSEITSMTFGLMSTGGQTLQNAGLEYAVTDYSIDFGTDFEAPELTNPNHLAVTYSSDKPEIVAVNAQTGAIEIKTYGTATITATSAATGEFKAGNASYTLHIAPAAGSIAQLFALVGEVANNKTTDYSVKCNFAAEITYVNGNNHYIADGQGGYTLIYEALAGFAEGDIINPGWNCKVQNYNGLYELVSVTGANNGGEGSFTPAALHLADITEANVSQVLVVTEVNFAEDILGYENGQTLKNFNGTYGNTTVQFRNSFHLGAQPAGRYMVKVAVGIYNGTVQLQPIEYMTLRREISFHKHVFNEETGEYEITEIESLDNISLEGMHFLEIRFSEGDGESVYYRHGYSPEVEAPARAAADFIEYTGEEPVKLDKAGTLEYYTERNGIATPVKAVELSGEVSGIENIAVDAATEAVYYNLQGVRVAAPAVGTYIRVINGTATKVRL